MQCDLGSLAIPKVISKNTGEEIENDPILKLLQRPNPFQTGKQLRWDYFFRRSLGTGRLYVSSNNVLNSTTKMYMLDNAKMCYPTEMMQNSDKLILSDSKLKEWQKYKIEYKYKDGTSTHIENKDIINFFDLTNSTGDWSSSPSVITALRKVIDNSEKALDALNTNLHMSGRFLAGGKVGEGDVSKMMMGDNEKKTIEDMVMSKKKVHAIKDQVTISRFVENFNKLQLPETYTTQYFIIGSIFGIPRDVLEANLEGSTYENQIRAMQRHVEHTLKPSIDDFANGLEKHFGYDDKDIVFSWDHLGLSQYAETERAEKNKLNAETFTILTDAGIDPEEAGRMLGFNFEKYGAGNNEA